MRATTAVTGEEWEADVGSRTARDDILAATRAGAVWGPVCAVALGVGLAAVPVSSVVLGVDDPDPDLVVGTLHLLGLALVAGTVGGLVVGASTGLFAGILVIGVRRLRSFAGRFLGALAATALVVAALHVSLTSVLVLLLGVGDPRPPWLSAAATWSATWPIWSSVRRSCVMTDGVEGEIHRPGIQVRTLVRASRDRLWALTQDPTLHSRWDLRFARIEPTGRGTFSYRRFGVRGTGSHAGERRRAGGGATSALTFACAHPLSPIESGAGYWRYRPLDGASTEFSTGYDYRPRYRRPDRLFRPAMAWATAWSFDRLRLWAERGISPEVSLALALVEAAARGALVVGALGLSIQHGRSAATIAMVVGVVVASSLPALPWRPSARRTTWSWNPAANRSKEMTS